MSISSSSNGLSTSIDNSEVEGENIQNSQLENLTKPNNAIYSNDSMLGHILPLYHMYTSVVSKSLNAIDDVRNNICPPPTYDDHSTIYSSGAISNASDLVDVNSNVSTSNTSSSFNVTPQTGDANFIVADESNPEWHNTILDNAHRLQNLDCKDIEMEVKFTKEVGQIGVKPEFIDILNFEYKQGDLINGYILVKNNSLKPIIFDMFYVVFEGYYRVRSLVKGPDNKDVYTKKFLELFDFSASWNYAHITRFADDTTSPYQCRDFIDPSDNTVYAFGRSRNVTPGYTYKRYFTFKIPDFLLDSNCNHNLVRHSEIPPTLGDQLIGDRKRNTTSATTHDGRLRDFLFMDSNISYNISARFIGKPLKKSSDSSSSKNKVKVANTEGAEFAIIKENVTPIRILQESKLFSDSERKYMDKVSKLQLDNIFENVDDNIGYGMSLLGSAPAGSSDSRRGSFPLLSPTSSVTINTFSRSNSLLEQSRYSESVNHGLAKANQTYKPFDFTSKKFSIENNNDLYKIRYPMEKKTFTSTKKLGELCISTPKTIQTVKYIPPPSFYYTIDERRYKDINWKLEFPIDIEFSSDFKLDPSSPSSSTSKFPEFKSIKAELMVLTLRSEKGSFPFDISYDMIIDDDVTVSKPPKNFYEGKNAFESNVLEPARLRATKLKSLSRKLGPELFSINATLARDLTSICKTSSKELGLCIDGIHVATEGNIQQTNSNLSLTGIPWVPTGNSTTEGRPYTYKKSLKVHLDLTTAKMKGLSKPDSCVYDEFCLIPTFQLCNIVRLYYIKLALILQKGEVLMLRVPFEIVK